MFASHSGPKGRQQVDGSADMKLQGEEQEPPQECLENSDPEPELNMADEAHLLTSSVPKGTAGLRHDGKVVSSCHVSVCVILVFN